MRYAIPAPSGTLQVVVVVNVCTTSAPLPQSASDRLAARPVIAVTVQDALDLGTNTIPSRARTVPEQLSAPVSSGVGRTRTAKGCASALHPLSITSSVLWKELTRPPISTLPIEMVRRRRRRMPPLLSLVPSQWICPTSFALEGHGWD